MPNKYYVLNIPESGEELYFSVGSLSRQIVFKDQELTISTVRDRLPEEGSELWNEMEEVPEKVFLYWLNGALACLNSVNWGQDPKKLEAKK
jgi:hypothetical protein